MGNANSKPSAEELNKRYLAACHAMQSGVAFKMDMDTKDTTPKHLRVGVNSAMCDSSALAGLLIRKGVITEAEYLEAITVMMEEEVDRYRQWFAARGMNVNLA